VHLTGDLWHSYQESFAFLLFLQRRKDKQRGCWLEGIDGDGTAVVGSTLFFDFKWQTCDAAELEQRASAAAAHLRTLETDVARMVASVISKGRGYVEQEEALSNALAVLHKAEWKLALLPSQVRKVIGRVGGRGAGLLGMRHQLHRLLMAARNAVTPPRLEKTVQWYRVDDWGNTEMIEGATDVQYKVMPHDVGFTLKAESTCRVMNWQPLDLDGIQGRWKFGTHPDSPADDTGLLLADTGADEDLAPDEAELNGSSRDAAEPGNNSGVTCKAFAYSKRVKTSCIVAVENLRVIGQCAQGNRISACWICRNTPRRKPALVRWWRSERDAEHCVLIEEGQMRPGPVAMDLRQPQRREDGLLLLKEAAVSVDDGTQCDITLPEESVGCWVWVEVLEVSESVESLASGEGISSVGASWRMAASRVQKSTHPTSGSAANKTEDALGAPPAASDHNLEKLILNIPNSSQSQSPLIAAMEVGGVGFKSPTNLSRELWREWEDANAPALQGPNNQLSDPRSIEKKKKSRATRSVPNTPPLVSSDPEVVSTAHDKFNKAEATEPPIRKDRLQERLFGDPVEGQSTSAGLSPPKPAGGSPSARVLPMKVRLEMWLSLAITAGGGSVQVCVVVRVCCASVCGDSVKVGRLWKIREFSVRPL